MKTIKIQGKAIPCYKTMGAFLKFKALTGEEATAIGGGEVSKLVAYLYCLCFCASKAEGKEFDYDLEEFAVNLLPEAFNAWCEDFVNEAVSEAQSQKKQKKTKA